MKLITILIAKGKPPEGLGALPYKTHPRIGEWVEIERDHKGIICEVIMIAHSTAGGASDVYLKEIGDSVSAIGALRRSV